MQFVLIIHEVADYAAWKVVFDRAATLRRDAGEIAYQVLKYDDANHIVHFSRWRSLSEARAFFESEALVDIRAQAGVKAPEFVYLDQLESGVLEPTARKIGRSMRKLVALLFVLLGAQVVSAVVDITPVLGSPQLDYPAIDMDQPFWPQFGLLWAIFGLGGGLWAGLGMVAWSDEPIHRLSPPRVAIVAVACLALVAGAQLAGFVANGTMGPLHVQQPIFRFALVNGAVSSVVITLGWSLACIGVHRMIRRFGKPNAALVSFAGAGLAAMSVILCIALSTGLPLLSTFNWWWPGPLILALGVALLVSLAPASQGRPPAQG